MYVSPSSGKWAAALRFDGGEHEWGRKLLDNVVHWKRRHLQRMV
jgi:hypothetical protein